MSAEERLQEELLEAYQDELTSALNYQAHAKRVEGFFGEMLAEELEADVSDEFGHATEIATVLDEVFDVPVPSAGNLDLERQAFLESNETYTATESDIEELLGNLMQAEEEAIARYHTICELAVEAGYPEIRHLAEELLRDEKAHFDETESLREQFL